MPERRGSHRTRLEPNEDLVCGHLAGAAQLRPTVATPAYGKQLDRAGDRRNDRALLFRVPEEDLGACLIAALRRFASHECPLRGLDDHRENPIRNMEVPR